MVAASRYVAERGAGLTGMPVLLCNCTCCAKRPCMWICYSELCELRYGDTLL